MLSTFLFISECYEVADGKSGECFINIMEVHNN